MKAVPAVERGCLALNLCGITVETIHIPGE